MIYETLFLLCFASLCLFIYTCNCICCKSSFDHLGDFLFFRLPCGRLQLFKMTILKKWSDGKSAQIPYPEVSYEPVCQDPEGSKVVKKKLVTTPLEKAAFVLLVFIAVCIGLIMGLFALKVISEMMMEQDRLEQDRLASPSRPITTAVADQCTAEESDRFDCWPEYVGATKAKCEARGCCWKSATTHGPPYCFFPANYSGYTASNVQTTGEGITADLTKTTASPTLFPPDIKKLKLQVDFQTESRLRVKVRNCILFSDLA